MKKTVNHIPAMTEYIGKVDGLKLQLIQGIETSFAR